MGKHWIVPSSIGLPNSGPCRRHLANTFVMVMICLSCLSCGDGRVHTSAGEDQGRLSAIVMVYSRACRDKGTPPAATADLMTILAKAGAGEDVLTSTRDGEPFVIIWNLDLLGKYQGSTAPLAYEQNGVDGKRLVVNCRREVSEVSDAEFGQLKFPAGHKPVKSGR
ncbi:MAG: hypothetical protein R3E01_18475 [Pirellulaceae bacterium]|nr:hypothetical protein [Planctomycetales bacterium]